MTETIRATPLFSRRTALQVGAGGIALGMSAWCSTARAQTSSIKVGFPVPLTGPYGSEAADQARCAQLAIEDFNRTGGLKGRLAELLVRDDKLNRPKPSPERLS
jgi:branched-chain amino acid transport system substrate-binding protein